MFYLCLWVTRRRQWHPTPVLLPRKSHGQGSLVGCSPWGRKELDMTEQLHFHFSLSCIGGGNGNPLQCSCLENPRDGGAWWAAVYGVAQSQTQQKRLSSSSSSSMSYTRWIWGWASDWQCVTWHAGCTSTRRETSLRAVFITTQKTHHCGTWLARLWLGIWAIRYKTSDRIPLRLSLWLFSSFKNSLYFRGLRKLPQTHFSILLSNIKKNPSFEEKIVVLSHPLRNSMWKKWTGRQNLVKHMGIFLPPSEWSKMTVN